MTIKRMYTFLTKKEKSGKRKIINQKLMRTEKNKY